MSPSHYASISIPTRFINDVVKGWIVEEINIWNFDKATEEDGVTFFEDEYACQGYFQTLEEKLVEAQIPFDRSSSGSGETKPEIRYYRPGSIDKTIMVTNDGDSYIETYELKKLLNLPTPTDVLLKLIELLNEADPAVVPLEKLALEEAV